LIEKRYSIFIKIINNLLEKKDYFAFVYVIVLGHHFRVKPKIIKIIISQRKDSG
jgi:hypothetical protein